jgi:hypothetical protein
MSLFQASSGGSDWGESYELLLVTGDFAAAAYVVYILFCLIAAWNVVTSIFIERAMTLARSDMQTSILRKAKDAAQLWRLTMKADHDTSDTLSHEEFKEFMQDQSFRRFFELRGLDMKDVALFFHLLTSQSGCMEVDMERFVSGCMGMKGTASAMDLHALSHQVRVLQAGHREFMERSAGEHAEVKSALEGLRRGGT